jgi:DNA processing protein
VSEPFFRRDGSTLRARTLQWRVVEKAGDEYPANLRHVKDPPIRLWIAGRNLVELPVRIAIVGTRRANGYGLQVARDLASDLAQQGVSIVSGMALGIDAQAHRGALDVGGPTVAVLGSGVDVCQPATNADLYRAIAATGTIVSEQPPGTPGHAHHFPERNRIIAAISAAVVVVQAPIQTRPGKRSGAMITADRALDCGVAVLAVPGQVDWSVSTGVHELIRAGATICTGAGDVAHALQGRFHWTPDVEERPIPENLPAEQRRVLEILSAGAATRESLCASAGFDPRLALRAIAMLEIAGSIGPAPGGRLRRIR